MECPRCNGSNVSVQSVSTGNVGATQNKVVVQQPKKSKGCLYWMIFGWWIEPIIAIFRLFFGGKSRSGVNLYANKNIMKTVAVCQDCGMTWKPSGKIQTKKEEQDQNRETNEENSIIDRVSSLPAWAKYLCIIGIVIAAVMFFEAIGAFDEENKNTEKTDQEYMSSLDAFEYKVSGKKILLKKYKGESDFVKINAAYEVEGENLKTDLSDFQLQSDVNTVVFGNGIKEINNAVFNSSEVKAIYFPKTMKTVYDNTLAYLDPDYGEKIKVYYEGTKKQWKKIFKKYERKKFDEAETPEEKGASAADRLNELFGMEYDGSDFEFFFSADEEDIK